MAEHVPPRDAYRFAEIVEHHRCEAKGARIEGVFREELARMPADRGELARLGGAAVPTS